eukprot:TRINITY_DN2875_c0_g1_i1.p1 TRINITY_DN2875_c0_g1~~TRINITY_DN2875_c0_g1_i1.p1  ORF type:complete len:266 (-),score=8.40 TRINITY_DN2875_c0_g1_i1:296-1093(-)
MVAGSALWLLCLLGVVHCTPGWVKKAWDMQARAIETQTCSFPMIADDATILTPYGSLSKPVFQELCHNTLENFTIVNTQYWSNPRLNSGVLEQTLQVNFPRSNKGPQSTKDFIHFTFNSTAQQFVNITYYPLSNYTMLDVAPAPVRSDLTFEWLNLALNCTAWRNAYTLDAILDQPSVRLSGKEVVKACEGLKRGSTTFHFAPVFPVWSSPAYAVLSRWSILGIKTNNSPFQVNSLSVFHFDRSTNKIKHEQIYNPELPTSIVLG